MKKVLLTGGAGSIGYHFLKVFMEQTDWEVIVLDSFRHKGYGERIDYLFELSPECKKRIRIIQHDLVCPINNKMKEDIGSVDYILHLAAMSDVFWGQDNPTYILYNNYMSTITMCEYAKEIEHKAFIYFSTDEVYGPVKKGEAHKEWDTHRPSNFYSASKAASEDICYAYWRNGDIKLIITNTMNNFGEWQSASKFPVLVQRALENNEEVVIHGNEKEIGTRYYIHSKRVAETIINILKYFPITLHKIGELDEPDRYHIVGNHCLDNLELAKTIARLMGKELKYKLVDFHKDNPSHDIHYGLENNKITVEDDFENDLEETIEFQEENK